MRTLKFTLIIWGGVCFLAFSLDVNQANVDYYFYGLGIMLGFVLGATQSIGRSTYSKLLPVLDSSMRFHAKDGAAM